MFRNIRCRLGVQPSRLVLFHHSRGRIPEESRYVLLPSQIPLCRSQGNCRPRHIHGNPLYHYHRREILPHCPRLYKYISDKLSHVRIPGLYNDFDNAGVSALRLWNGGLP